MKVCMGTCPEISGWNKGRASVCEGPQLTFEGVAADPLPALAGDDAPVASAVGAPPVGPRLARQYLQRLEVVRLGSLLALATDLIAVRPAHLRPEAGLIRRHRDEDIVSFGLGFGHEVIIDNRLGVDLDVPAPVCAQRGQGGDGR